VTDGTEPQTDAEKSLGEIVAEVSEKASLLVREEIELAKAEVRDKVSKLTKGAVVAITAGVVLVFAVSIFLHGLAWFFNDLFDFDTLWQGFAIVFGLLLLLTALMTWLAVRWLRGGSPPTPDLAIEEAKLTRERFEHQGIERDQVQRTLKKGEEVPWN
jgi:Putative Actinobacterial Holin-X, holin superfamily III